LTRLLKQGVPWTWNNEQQEAYERLKQEFRENRILILYQPGWPCEVHTDASDKAIGAVLVQKDNQGINRLVAFYSRQMQGAEQRYDTHDKELLAIKAAMRHWRHYVEGSEHPVVVKSDHKNLTYFLTSKELTRRQARWAEELSRYNFRIEHVKGRGSQIPDLLSRRPDYQAIKGERALLRQRDDGNLEYNKIDIGALTEEVRLNEELKKAIVTETTNNELLNEMVNESPELFNRIEDGLIEFRGLIYIPKGAVREVIRNHHDDPTEGHQGTDRTTEKIGRNYYFPGMRK
jgi:RNase H-like domain found in reverse transcriptase/Integrase zinc binding domain